ncbi:hypothetical protein OUZ56_016263 [Daphnia magna]|uniref:Uncharacterized protein n=1 Tax=Daphnia magna TaxID=35525 RepID=A0ABR0AQ76_9CRUS|nr:hypothetical protein OUZ56_016263 [Daphnia magna]
MTDAKQIILSYSSLIKYCQLQVQPPHQLQRQLNLQLQRPHHLQHYLRLADSMGMDERTSRPYNNLHVAGPERESLLA